MIHIGWHKTGTTSVQNFLLNNRKYLQSEARTYYPDEGLLQCAHHLIAWTYQGRKTSPWGEIPVIDGGADSYVLRALDQATSKGCDTVIFSSEEFCTLKPQEVRRLSAALEGKVDEVSVVAYIRRQDKIIESAYNMEVKWWGVRSTVDFDHYCRGKEGYPNYFKTLSQWGACFGLESLVVRYFERAEFEQNDIRRDFCKQAGLDPDGLTFAGEDANDSLGPLSLEFMRMLNVLDMSRHDHERIVKTLVSRDKASGSPACVLFSPEARVNFMCHSQEINLRLAELGIDPRGLALDPSRVPEKNVRRLTLSEFLDLADSTGVERN